MIEQEAAPWAAGLKRPTGMLALATGRKATVDDLQNAIAFFKKTATSESRTPFLF